MIAVAEHRIVHRIADHIQFSDGDEPLSQASLKMLRFKHMGYYECRYVVHAYTVMILRTHIHTCMSVCMYSNRFNHGHY